MTATKGPDMDELYKKLRAFLDAHDMPEPRYIALGPNPNAYAAFDEVAETLSIDVKWEHLSSETCHATTVHDGMEISLIAREVVA